MYVELAGIGNCECCMPYEIGRTVFLCVEMNTAFQAIWPENDSSFEVLLGALSSPHQNRCTRFVRAGVVHFTIVHRRVTCFCLIHSCDLHTFRQHTLRRIIYGAMLPVCYADNEFGSSFLLNVRNERFSPRKIS